MGKITLPFVCGLMLPVAAQAAGEAPDALVQDQQMLKSAGLGTDDEALLEFFRKRTLREESLARIQTLIAELGDDAFEVREKASAALVELGPAAESALKEAARSTDPEVKKRAEECLGKLARGTTALVHAAARLLAARRPAGSAHVLFDYLPFAADDSTADAVCRALAQVSLKDGKPDSLLTEGLADKVAAKRLGAAVALVRAGLADLGPAVKKLLHDPEPLVRARVALVLVEEARQRDTVPVLIDLLDDTPAQKRWEIEDLLERIAGDKIPTELAKGSVKPDDRRALWSKWWKENGENIDLAKLELRPRVLGRTLIVERMKTGVNSGRVYEIDREGKVLWEIGGLRVPSDARLVGEERVLICESSLRRVTERNLKGEILWQYQAPNLVHNAQRLANGNTFVACRTSLIEVDKDGKEVSRVDLPPANQCYAAQKLRDGTIGLVSSSGRFVLLTADGKELKSFQVERPYAYSGIEVLKDGGLLLAAGAAGKAIRYDADGKAVWESAVQAPTAISLLPNGNALVTTSVGMAILELDRDGKEIRKIACEGRPVKAYGR